MFSRFTMAAKRHSGFRADHIIFISLFCRYVTIILQVMGQGNVSLSGIRAFRVLRALKSISVVPGES